MGYERPSIPLAAETRVATPSSLASGLAAYRDKIGTTLIAPKGWQCEAGVGVDGSQHIDVYPRGAENPAEYPAHSGEVVNLKIASACQRLHR
jgi:hypothetical protein